MRIGTAAFIQSEQITLQLLSRSQSLGQQAGSRSSGRGAGSGPTASANDLLGGLTGNVAGAGALQTYSASGTMSDAGNAIAAIKAMAKSSAFRNAAMGSADDQVRALVREGKLAQLPALDPSQWASLSKNEQNIYGVVRTLQGLYDAQPKTIEQALSDHVKVVLESYPDAIARMQDSIASGTSPDGDMVKQEIARFQDELAAAQQGHMQIHAVTDQRLVTSTAEFAVSGGESGWSGRGISVQADISALQSAYGTKNVLPGASPYAGAYVITW